MNRLVRDPRNHKSHSVTKAECDLREESCHTPGGHPKRRVALMSTAPSSHNQHRTHIILTHGVHTDSRSVAPNHPQPHTCSSKKRSCICTPYHNKLSKETPKRTGSPVEALSGNAHMYG